MYKYALVAVTLIVFATPALAKYYVLKEAHGCSVQELSDSEAAKNYSKIVGNGFTEEPNARNAMASEPNCQKPM